MSIHFKSNPKLDWGMLAPQIVLALAVASECFAEEGEDCLVTCLRRPGTFATQGFHFDGRAVDLGVRRVRGGEDIPEDKMDRIVLKLEARLGRSGGGPFDVVDERKPGSSPGWTGPHIHLEFQPR
jgi:hypothetical protein